MTSHPPAHLPDGVRLISDPMPGVTIDIPSARATVLFHGAHVLSWTPTGHQDVIWLSPTSHYGEDAAVRGGVPICFPWFGPGRSGDQKPAHGWARQVPWTLVGASVDATGPDSAGCARLVFTVDGAAIAGRPGADALVDAAIEYRVSVGSELRLELIVNAGAHPVDVEAALHTYFRVDEIATTTVQGLDGVDYWDKVSDQHARQSGAVSFAGETDRVYEAAGEVQVVTDQRTITVRPQGATRTVVWNPGPERAAAMSDLEGWQQLVCVETACVREAPIVVMPGQRHVMSVTYSLS